MTPTNEQQVATRNIVDYSTTHNVKQTIDRIRAMSPVIKGLEAEGKLKVVGAMYDITTGKVTFL